MSQPKIVNQKQQE
jgi:hypothetical protein